MAEDIKLADSIYIKLMEVQQALKAPKDQSGRFGSHRNAEGILAAVKPLLKEQLLALTLNSQIIHLEGRHYVEATATVFDAKGDAIFVKAQAWEGEISRGLDAPQVTGAATSYARKFALGGLFDIDDSKDDPDQHQEPAPEPSKIKKATASEKFKLQQMMKAKAMTTEEMTMFIESVINKKKVETHDEFVEIYHALNDEMGENE
jgi:hypothetical protein